MILANKSLNFKNSFAMRHGGKIASLIVAITGLVCLANLPTSDPTWTMLRRLQEDGATDPDADPGGDFKPLFPLREEDYLGLLFATMGLIVAAGGGIGGGGILVPIYILVLQFPAKNAIPLSNVTVFGGAVANTLLNSRKRHPLADRPLIDWDLLLMMEPLTIGGALIGTNLNKLLPELAILIMLVVLLSATAYITLKKAHKMYLKEMLGFSKVQTDDDERDVEAQDNVELSPAASNNKADPVLKSQPSDDKSTGEKKDEIIDNGPKLVQNDSLPKESKQSPEDESKQDATTNDHVEDTSVHFEDEHALHFSAHVMGNEEICVHKQGTHLRTCTLENVLEEEQRAPPRNVITILIMFLLVLAMNIMKGGGGFESPVGIECGSLSFWGVEVSIFVFILVVCWTSRSHLIQRTHLKQAMGYKYVEGDIRWDERSTITYPLVCCLAGLVAGMFGVGGGIVKGPLMLALGVHPMVASATSACMILFTSFTATTSFMIFGLLVTDYAVACLVLGFVATIVGQTVMSLLLRRYKRNSYIAFSIGIVVAISAICMSTESIISLRGQGMSRGSGSLCNLHSHLEI